MKKRAVSLVCALLMLSVMLTEPVFAVSSSELPSTGEASIAESSSEAENSLNTAAPAESAAGESEDHAASGQDAMPSASVPERGENTENSAVSGETGKDETASASPDLEAILDAEVSADGTSAEFKLWQYQPSEGNEIEFEIFAPGTGAPEGQKYKAEMREDAYQYTEDLSVYKEVGIYTVRAYDKKPGGEKALVKERQFTVLGVNAGSVASCQLGEKQFEVVVSEIDRPALLDKIFVRVKAAPEDDFTVYEAVLKEDGGYTAVVDVGAHGNFEGTYSVSIYALLKNGAAVFLQNADVEMAKAPLDNAELPPVAAAESLPEGTVEASNFNNTEGTFDVTLSVDGQDNIDTVYLAAWPKDGQGGEHWYTAEKQPDGTYVARVDVKNHWYRMGEYYLHGYVRDKQGNMIYIGKTTHTLELNAGEVTQSATGKAYSTRLTISDVEEQGIAEKVCFAVWSAEGGQDDLYWYDTVKNGNSYSADVSFLNHRNTGKYYVHIYLIDKNGTSVCLKESAIQVDTLPEEKVEASNFNTIEGTFDVTLSAVRPQSDIDTVYLAAWPKDGQGSEYWYTAARQPDGTYVARVDVKNHRYRIGEYYLHGYVRDKRGNMIYIGKTTHTLELNAGEVTQSATGNAYSTRLTISEVEEQGIAEKVCFAVWSAEGGQDDLYWYDTVKNGNSYSTDIFLFNHKNTGKFYVHVYLIDKNGTSVCLKESAIQVDTLPEEKVEASNFNTIEGTFDVTLSAVRPQSDIDTVYLAAWPKDGQGSEYWYTAARQPDGTYVARVDVKNHRYRIGEYYLHGYVRDKRGNMIYIGKTTHTLEINAGEVTQSATGKDYSTRLTISDVEGQGIAEKVCFAVWSAEGGQDDLYWYDTVKNGNSYSADIFLFNHKNTGKFYVHVYLIDKNGTSVCLKESAIQVDKLPEETADISNVNQTEGTFDVTVYLSRPDSLVKRVLVPIWTSADQSDIYWYEAARQSNGSYMVKADAMKHRWHSGRYIVDAYVQNYTGDMQPVKGAETQMKLGVKAVTETLDTRSVRLKVYGIDSGVKDMSVPTWSVKDGQDDIVWYKAEKGADGVWSAVVASKNHNTAGRYTSDFYTFEADGRLTKVGGVDFSIAEKWENTWRWIDGYKRYINAGGDVAEDVSDLVTGPYYIKVYKPANYVIVFAKDDLGQYKVPVKAMIASCGNNTPTGTYYMPWKSQWLTMIGDSEAQWCTQIKGDFLFHSVPYRIRDPKTLYVDSMYNYLGTTQSLGCIRLRAGDAKWLFDNCSIGTEIYITPWESSGPIAKPSFTPLPSWHTWDPTDPNVRYLCAQRGCH